MMRIWALCFFALSSLMSCAVTLGPPDSSLLEVQPGLVCLAGEDQAELEATVTDTTFRIQSVSLSISDPTVFEAVEQQSPVLLANRVRLLLRKSNFKLERTARATLRVANPSGQVLARTILVGLTPGTRCLDTVTP